MTPAETFQPAKLAGVPLELTIVSTPLDMAKGLSGRLIMPVNQAMLFIYSNYSQRHFWMNNMRFPLDILWLSNGVIVGVAEQVPIPVIGGDIPRVTSPEGVNQVLELNAGFAARYGIKLGDRLELLTD